MYRLQAVLSLVPVLTPLAMAAQQDTVRWDSRHRYPVEELARDFAVLRASLEEGHAGMYRYVSKADLDARFESTAAALTEPLTEFEFVQRLAPLVAAIRDGHTRLEASFGLSTYLDQQPIRLPFKLRVLGDQAYMHRNYMDDPNFSMGGRLLSINGVPMEDVLARMLPLVGADGHGVTAKFKNLEGTSTFGLTYSLAFGLTTRFDVRYVSDDGEERGISVGGLPAADVANRFQTRYPNAPLGSWPIDLSYRDGVAVLKVTTFVKDAYDRLSISYPTFLENAFEELRDRNIENLVIDVRDNGGGSDVYGRMLLAHLLPDNFEYYRTLELLHREYAFLRFTNASIRDIPQNRLHRNEHGSFNLGGHPNLGILTPQQPVFGGSVYVLINGASFSATSEFTSALHHAGRATFVGEEGGGGYYGNTSGFVPTLTLPNTGVRLQLPMVRYTMAVDGYEPRDRGLIPDHLVVPTIDDVLFGHEVELEYTLGLIRSGGR